MPIQPLHSEPSCSLPMGVWATALAPEALDVVVQRATPPESPASPKPTDAEQRVAALGAALGQALDQQELSLHYQPQIDLRSGAMYGVEALLRWHSAALGQVAPDEFIAVAEQTGHMAAIGEWVLRTACAQAAAWRRAGMSGLRIAVNISGRQLEQDDLAQRIQAILLETGADPAMLGVEVTEAMLVGDATRAARTLHALRAIGMEISLDDFGTGYSNLSVLRSLPIDVLKIDRSYVHDVTAAPAKVSVTRAVITMAHSLHMKVLAEGVETEGQLALLMANRCDAIQGYFFSRPVSAQDIEALWQEKRSLPSKYITAPPRQRTLLLVDDEENIVAALRRSLRRGGYRILTANSAAEGLQRLAECEVDVIVSDQRMPGMTGVEFLRRAKTLYPGTVRIVLSGYTELQSITDAINEGAIYKFLTKPWEDDLLRANIEEAFRQKEMADENCRLDLEVRKANEELAEVNQRLESALAEQRKQLKLIEARGSSALELLLSVPVPLIGIDDEGLVAFVNRDAELLLPECTALVGRDADEALPPALRPMLQWPDEVPATLILNGQPCRCISRTMTADGDTRGRLLLVIPNATAAEPH
ncbi:MAG TPA: EAL domain-containing protein [Ideonella sp.]|uniref:EAL domain-containing protein n=1 Tax=Ideonella sp. TaxID=1929293 RepID=UPI002E317F90|nr:EAL domain-containing protein [Ideonella sp.]HEX5685867.1 EAL domain-containing protein [Ideonella sp.]